MVVNICLAGRGIKLKIEAGCGILKNLMGGISRDKISV